MTWVTDTQQLAMCLQCQEELLCNWLCQKQATVTLSTAEAEYIALGSGIQDQLNPLRSSLVKSITNWSKIDTKGSIGILEDNQSAIAMAKNCRT